MISKDIKKLIGPLYGVLLLEDIVLHRHRKTLQKFFGVAALVAFLIFSFMGAEYPIVKGIFLICLSLYFIFFMLECYFYSFYERSQESPKLLPFEIAGMLFYCDGKDLVKGFLFSEIGDRTMKKLGIEEEEIREFLHGKQKIDFSWTESTVRPATPKDYAALMFKIDQDFVDFIFRKGITVENFGGALDWTIAEDRRIIEDERVWSDAHLLRIPALGKNWAYGQTYILERYGDDITSAPSSFLPSYETTHDANIGRLESILSKTSGANCIITSDDEASRMDIISMLAGKVRKNESLAPLAHQRIFVLNGNLIIENSSDKISFETDFSEVLAQSILAHNIILVIPYFSSFIKSAQVLGADVVSILIPYLQSPLLHVIGLDSKEAFHSFLENKQDLLEHFDTLKIDSGSGEGVIFMLERQAEEIEKEAHLTITYTALVAISDNAKQYFDSFAYADKAKDLLLEAVPYCLSHGFKMLLPEHVLTLVTARTGVPSGIPKGEEKDKLLNLEKILHERIVGQNEAVKAISQALRRSRAGVQNPNRPIGSFLFLGPTGVGKTETTKALAQVFFSSADSMSRLDMSEYKNADALTRLIGSFEEGKMGILATTIREKPYAVLLLDEFEKTNDDVLNLFLQILDEGVFSDSSGKKVNARNNIIIATSNAGSELIWEKVKAGEDISLKKDEIVQAIIEQGIFKPELLNRFDGVILFHPLAAEDLRKIARLMMQKFAQRMNEKGIEVLIDDAVISFLVSKGTDPKFGARPMNRAIQEDVEALFAENIISGIVTKGSRVSFEIEGDSVIKLIIK